MDENGDGVNGDDGDEDGDDINGDDRVADGDRDRNGTNGRKKHS